jgi:hypothetical protein
MSTPWSKLVEIREEIPVAKLDVRLDLPLRSLPLLGESPQALENCRFRDWFKIGSQQFLQTRYDAPPLFFGVAWASSDGAFAYALTGDTFFDDDTSQIPPAELLPDGRSYDWQAVARLGRELGSQHFHDYVGWPSVREVAYDRFTFYYRHTSPDLQEPPFCIKIRPFRRPDIG